MNKDEEECRSTVKKKSKMIQPDPEFYVLSRRYECRWWDQGEQFRAMERKILKKRIWIELAMAQLGKYFEVLSKLVKIKRHLNSMKNVVDEVQMKNSVVFRKKKLRLQEEMRRSLKFPSTEKSILKLKIQFQSKQLEFLRTLMNRQEVSQTHPTRDRGALESNFNNQSTLLAQLQSELNVIFTDNIELNAMLLFELKRPLHVVPAWIGGPSNSGVELKGGHRYDYVLLSLISCLFSVRKNLDGSY